MIESIGRYRIVQELEKRAGMSIWLADDATLARRVRLDVVPVIDPQADVLRARFAREAQTASQLHHGCIATVYDAGTADGFHYIARQLLDGEPVRERIARREPIAAAGLLQVAADIASALQSLHEHGLVHGEVDTESIHVTDDGHAFLDGFGLASMARESGATPKDDLHGLGNVLASMRSHATAVSPDLERLIDELRARRPTTAALLSEELRRMQGGREAPGRDESTIAVAIQPVRAGRGIRTKVVIATILIVVLGAGVTYILGRPKTAVPSVAMLPLVEERPDSTGVDPLMDGIGESVVTKLSQVAGVRVTPWMTVQRYADTDRPLPELARELGVAQLVVGSFDGVGDSVRVAVRLVDGVTGEERWQAEYGGLRTGVLDLQRNLAVDVARELRVRLSKEQRRTLRQTAARNPEAWECYLRGAQAMQEETFLENRRASDLFERALALDPDLAEAYVGLGAAQTQAQWRQWEPKERTLQDAEANFRRALRLEPRLASARRGLIRIHFQRSEGEECLKIGQDVERLGLVDVENLLVRGDAYQFGGLAEEAVAMYQRAMALDPANEAALAMLVVTLQGCGRFEESLERGQLFEERFGGALEVLWFMGRSCICLGDWECARDYCERANEFTRTLGLDLFEIYRHLGDDQKAHHYLLESLGAYEGLLSEQPTSITGLWGLGETHLALGDTARALEYEQRLARILPQSSQTLAFRASLLMDSGRLGAGFDLWHEVLRRGDIPVDPNTCAALVKPNVMNAPEFSNYVAESKRIKERRRAQYGAGIVAEAARAAAP